MTIVIREDREKGSELFLRSWTAATRPARLTACLDLTIRPRGRPRKRAGGTQK